MGASGMHSGQSSQKLVEAERHWLLLPVVVENPGWRASLICIFILEEWPLAKENIDSVLMASGGRWGKLKSWLLWGGLRHCLRKNIRSPDVALTGIFCHFHLQWQDSISCPSSSYLTLNATNLCRYDFTDNMWEICFALCSTPILSGIVCTLCPSPLPVPVIQAFIWLIKRITLSAVPDVIKFSIFPSLYFKDRGMGPLSLRTQWRQRGLASWEKWAASWRGRARASRLGLANSASVGMTRLQGASTPGGLANSCNHSLKLSYT